MSVTTKGNIVTIVHSGVGTPEKGQQLADHLYSQALEAIKHYPRVAFYHDVANLASATEAYARPFGEKAKILGNEKYVYVCYITKAWLRVLAFFAGKIGGVTVLAFKTEAAAFEHLRKEGFAV